jgi:hypothetical protein
MAQGPQQGRILSGNNFAAASFSLSSNDLMTFPAVPCGKDPVTSPLNITNQGGAALMVSAAATGDGFSVDPMVLEVKPGDMGTLTVSASAPASAIAGVPLMGALTLGTNDPNQKSVVYQLNATPRGATLTFPQGAFAFPPTLVGTTYSPRLTRTLQNTGDAPATFTLGTPSSSIFSLFLGGADTGDGGAPSIVLNPGQTWPISADFSPTSQTVFVATSAITVTGATCGTSQTSFGFSGAGAFGSLQGWPTAPIDFGAALCGGAPPASQTFTLTNTGLAYANVTSVSVTGGFTTDLNVGRAIAPNTSHVVTVMAPSVPLNAPLTALTGTLSVETDADASPHLATLTEEPSGAILAWDTSGTGATTNFGSFGPVQLLASASQTLRVVNRGSGGAPASVSLAASQDGDAGSVSDFTVAPSTFTVAPGSGQAASVTFSPTDAPAVTGSIAMSATGPICGALPAPLALSGSGLGGGPVITASSLTFGATCGGPAPSAQSFMIQNVGPDEFTWAMSGPTGAGASRYMASSFPPPGLLLPGATAFIAVTASPIPSPATTTAPSAYAAKLTITTDVPFDAPHVVSLGEVPLGDQLAFSTPGPIRFGQVATQTMLTQPFTVTNNASAGSPPATVSFALSGDGAGGYATPAPLSNLAPGASSRGSLTFSPPGALYYPATLNIVTADPLCTPLPAPISVSGTGTQAVVSVSAASLSFGTDPADPQGLVNCGAQGPSRALTVANLGNLDFHVTGLVLGKGAASPFAIQSATSPLDAPIGGAATIIVQPSPIPSVADPNDPAAFSDVLTMTTDAAGDAPHQVSLVMQPRGAVIADTPLTTSWAFGTVSFGSIGTVSSSIQNTGNADATVTLLGLTQPTIFGLQNNPTLVPAGGAVTSVVGQFTPPAASAQWSDSGTLVVSASLAFCAPLPAQWTGPTILVSGSAP